MDKIRQLISDVKEIINQLKREKRGRSKKRRGRPIREEVLWEMVLIKLLARVMRWNIRQTHRNLTGRDPTFRRLIGIKLSEIPPYRTLVHRWHNPKVYMYQQRVYKRLLRGILTKRNLRVTLIDMTDLPVSLKDELAEWGYCSKGRLYGYKLHMVTSSDGIPIALVVSRGNLVESSVNERLIGRVERNLNDDQIEKILYMVGDAGYDGEANYDDVERILDAKLVCAVNPRRDADLKDLRGKGELCQEKRKQLEESDSNRARGILLYLTKREELYERRIWIEQSISILTTLLSMKDIPYWVRGVRRVARWVFDHIFAFVCIAYCNKKHGRRIRQVAPYLI